MKFVTALREYPRRRIELMEEADIVIGIPCYNNDQTIAYVMETASEGIARYFPDSKALIMVADGGSTDDTREIAREVQIHPWIEKIIFIYRGLPGKGSALRAIFESVKMLKAKVCVVCDSDLRSITPEWIKWLAEPILEGGFHYVSPIYARYKYDGTITNNIVYCLTRALYGKRIRQPIGGDFGFSRNLAEFFVEHDVWQTDVAKYGIDIWMTTSAITENFKICQAKLGVKIHDVKDPAQTLGPMFRQVVSTLFLLMEHHEDRWKKIKGSEETEIFGTCEEIEPKPFVVDLPNLVSNFKIGYEHFSPLWEKILHPENFVKVKELENKEIDEFLMPSEVWAKIVYDFAATFHKWTKNRYKLVEMMTPLYYARVASFVNETKDMSNKEAEEMVEKQSVIFEELKPYLIEMWDKK